MKNMLYKNNKAYFLLLLLNSFSIYSQVGISTTSPATTLEIRGKNHAAGPGAVDSKDGLLVPRVNDLATNGTQNGQLVYVMQAATNPATKSFNYWDGAVWQPIDTDKEPWYKAGTSNPSYSNTDDIYTNGKVAIKAAASDLTKYTNYTNHPNTAANVPSATLDIGGGLQVTNIPAVAQNTPISPAYIQWYFDPTNGTQSVTPGFVVRPPAGYFDTAANLGEVNRNLSASVDNGTSSPYLQISSIGKGVSNVYISGKDANGKYFAATFLVSYSTDNNSISGNLIASSTSMSGGADAYTPSSGRAVNNAAAGYSNIDITFAGTNPFIIKFWFSLSSGSARAYITNNSSRTIDVSIKSTKVF